MNNLKRSMIAGAVYGFAIGDAMGATTEFMTKGQIERVYGVVDDIIGGGWLNLEPGQVTDDTQMTICVMKALQKTVSENADDAFGMSFLLECRNNFIEWYETNPKDVGHQCASAIRMMQKGKFGAEKDNCARGNGSLMRALPCAILDLPFLNEAQGRLTHNSNQCTECIGFYHKNIVSLIDDHLATRMMSHPKDVMDPSGHVLNTIVNAMHWASNERTFEDVIIKAVNHGGDADTIAAIAGSLAGARFGIDAIPEKWIKKLDCNVKKDLQNFINFAFSYLQI